MNRRWLCGVVGLGLTILYLGAVGMRSPQHAWNDVRLAAAAMVWNGPASGPYAPAGGGPVSTWIYGPASLIWWGPATAFRTALGALSAACAINALTLIASLAGATGSAENTARSLASRWIALFLAVALWPRFSFEYLVADNLALAAALVANALLLRKNPAIIGAAVCTGIAILSKQTILPLALAQALWLTRRHSYRAGILSLTWTGAIAGIGFAGTFLSFGSTAVAYNLITIPTAIPWGAPLAKLSPIEHWPYVLVLVILPLSALPIEGGRWWRLSSNWSLPVWSMLALLPGSMASFFKVGGSINSLSAALLLVPGVAIALAQSRYVRPAALLAGIWLICQAGFLGIATHAHRDVLRTGTELVQAYRGRIHLPWHPLLQAKTEGVYYHTEDGLLTRLAIGEPYSNEALAAHQPHAGPLILGYAAEDPRGYLTTLLPAESVIVQVGAWTLYASPPPSNP